MEIRDHEARPADRGGISQSSLRHAGIINGVSIRVSLWTLLVVDFCMALLVTSFAFEWNPWGVTDIQHVSIAAYSVTFAIILLLFGQILGLYDTRRLPGLWELSYKIILVAMFSVLAVNLVSMLLLYERVGRYISLLTLTMTICGLSLFRLLIYVVFSNRQRLRIAFIGPTAFSEGARTQVEIIASNFFEVIPCPRAKVVDIVQWVCEERIDELVTDSVCTEITHRDVMRCNFRGTKVCTHSDFFEHNFLRVNVSELDTPWLINARLSASNTGYYALLKRSIDICASVFGLLVVAPIIFIAIVAIKIESRGSAIYAQKRVGLMGRDFTIYKLRSMFESAEKQGACWAQVDDPRVTIVGAFLRKSRIDELPQLWNVLRGEMSLVGPRPERPVFVAKLSESIPFYEQRQTVKPGITGWAQINYPYGASEEDAKNKLSYDLYYAKNLSVGLDLRIVLRTIGSMVTGAR